MPFVSVEAWEGYSVQQKRDLVKGVTEAIVSAYGVPREAVRIVLRDLPKENIARGGILECDK